MVRGMAVSDQRLGGAAPLKLQRTLIRRAENYEAFPITALEAVVALRRCLDEVEKMAVQTARANGAPWNDLADALGVTRQALYQKYRSLNGASPTRE
jgi:hypothetical protein